MKPTLKTFFIWFECRFCRF